jgi:hypothetical protein
VHAAQVIDDLTLSIVNTAWSLARLEVDDAPWMDAISAAALAKISSFDHQ